jgi:HK97 family phage prohead protease
MTRELQRRHATPAAGRPTVETRADGKPMIVGYAARYFDPADPGTEFALWDDVTERILPGAFDKAVREDDVRALFNHSPDMVLGRSTAGTLRLSVDARGLRYEIDPPDTSTARDLLESLKRGDVSGSSFAFNIRGENVRKEAKPDGGFRYVRELTDVQLFDVGPVTYPAYPATDAGVRGDYPLADEAETVRTVIRNRESVGIRAEQDAVEVAAVLAEMELAEVG